MGNEGQEFIVLEERALFDDREARKVRGNCPNKQMVEKGKRKSWVE